jgi:hypothetical protein
VTPAPPPTCSAPSQDVGAIFSASLICLVYSTRGLTHAHQLALIFIVISVLDRTIDRRRAE